LQEIILSQARITEHLPVNISVTEGLQSQQKPFKGDNVRQWTQQVVQGIFQQQVVAGRPTDARERGRQSAG